MKLIRIILLPVSLLYGFLLMIRNFLFDAGILRSREFSLPVICIGNLSIGGTGKTPHTEYLIHLLVQHKYNVATLSRGYGRYSRGFVLADENTDSTSIGDEPAQFKHKFRKIPVAVDANRARGIKKLTGKIPEINTILLDDAFQHRSIKPGLSILLTDYSKLYINDLMVPSGFLREPKAGSSRADIIVVTKTPLIFSPLERRIIKQKLSPKPYQSIYFSYINYGDFVPLFDKSRSKTLSKEYYFERDFSVVLVTGIARASQLAYYVKNNVKELEHLKFPDHHRYSLEDIKKIRKIFDNIANENKIVLTTEKDAMRLKIPGLQDELSDLPVFYLPVEVDFHKKDKDSFDKEILDFVRSNQIDSRIGK